MRRDYVKWYSPSLHQDMELLAYGEHGFPITVFATSGGRFFEYEERGMIHALAPKIERGELQVFCVDSVDRSSWYNSWLAPADKLHRQNAYDAYLTYEFTPFLKQRTDWPQFGTTGCSLGGYHAIQYALRHPDLVPYAVSMCGAFDIPKRFLGGYYDENAYFNSPLDYLPQMDDAWFLDRLRRNYYVLATGWGDPLLDQSTRLAQEFSSKQIPHLLDIWEGFGHDWPWWQQMAQKFFL